MKQTKVEKAKAAYDEMRLRDVQYDNIVKVNHCLPKRKAKRFETVIIPAYSVRMINTRNAFMALYKKLTDKQKDELEKLVIAAGAIA